MPYITREDGERFIIPSYRDTLSVKKSNLLKKEVMLLSANYGEYITLQKKSVDQYEIAFSPDPGYLLGECVWHYFKRPYDMIYCEAIPNTNEAILVIVKSGSVYLDGSFPLDSIPEELVIFKTQQNNFSIFTYGEVPISQTPEDGKFSFDASSVRSFTVLDSAVFPTLPGVKAFQLQLVDAVLKSYGIGVIPLKKIVSFLALLLFVWAAYHYLSSNVTKEIPVIIRQPPSNPYADYDSQMESPDPVAQIHNVYDEINLLFTIPGWLPQSADYNSGFPASMSALIKSEGARTEILQEWALRNTAKLDIKPDGIYMTLYSASPRREAPRTINRLQDVIANLLDSLSYVLPGNNISFTPFADKKAYKETTISINLSSISPFEFILIGECLKGLPLVLSKISLTFNNDGSLSGLITVKALGN